MSQTPSILLERDKSHSNQMLAQRLRSASAVQLELNVIGVNDASSMCLQWWWWSSVRFKVLRPVVKWFGTRDDGVHEVGYDRLHRQLRIWWIGWQHS